MPTLLSSAGHPAPLKRPFGGKDLREERRPRVLRALLGAVLGVSIALATVAYLKSGREAALRDAEREVQNLALVLGNWFEDGFRSIEQLELGIAEWVHAQGVSTPGEFHDRLATPETYDMLRRSVSAAPRIERFFLIDHQGQLVANSAAFPAPDINVLGRDYFEALRSGVGPDTVLSSPARSYNDGRWSVFVAHRLLTEDGRFLGVIGAAIDLRRLEGFFAKLALGAGSSITLAHRDAVLLARHPWLEDRIGGSLATSETFTRVLPATSFGSFRSISTLDGIERVFGLKALDEYPLVVVATRSAKEVLAAWRSEARRLVATVGLVEVLIILGVLLFGRLAGQRAAVRRLEAERGAAESRIAIAERDAAFSAVFHTGAAGITELDVTTGRYLRVNQRFCDLVGRSEAELTGGLGPGDILHPEDRERFRDLVRPAHLTSSGWDGEIRYVRPDGEITWARLSAGVSARDQDGQALRCIGVTQDVTEARQASERLRESEALLRIGQRAGRIGSFSRDIATGALRCSHETREMFGLPVGHDPISTEVWMATVVPEDRERLTAAIADAIDSGAPEIAADYRMLRATDGSLRHIEMRASYKFGPDGRPVSSVGVAIDVTERKEAEERLRASESFLRLSMEVGRIGCFTRDFSTRALICGPETRALLGLPPGDEPVTEATWLATVAQEDRADLIAKVADAQARQLPGVALQYRIRLPDTGELRHIDARGRYEYDSEGRPLSSVGVVIDVTEQRQTEARIAHLARHDPLTDLPNRVLFGERLDGALARARRGEGFAVLCIDLDRFKEVNDTLGHPAGDLLLREVTARLRAELRDTDTLARLGGDEFAIIQPSVDQPRDATALARRLVEVIDMPFSLDGHQVVVGTSIGIAVAPVDAMERDALLKAADMALYGAKAAGRGRWRFFEPEMDARMQLRRTVELDLRRALVAGEFELHYQPIMEVVSRRVLGLEALIRWRHPGRGLVLPDAFIPLTEEIGLIVPLGEWVLNRACAEAVTWVGGPKVAVNLSPAQFASRRLVDTVAAALNESGLEPGRLELEITEAVMLQDTEATLATLHRLKALGVRVAMDDFGTGYSSLSYLQRFPFDKVKIDRSFTRGLDLSRQSNAIVRAMTDLCAGLDMITTAEGVETAEQFSALQRKGCNEAQGYLFSKPLPAAEIPALLERLNRQAAGLAEASSDMGETILGPHRSGNTQAA
ncbi:bifunctional diguanylate cyclase/phosphodiesterase [Muricoccus aerilatus]|uniref:bifunctional diguanylate cyclase/phosphodiesterase n=1 Tax=Muricoccus aerilatus TaxID=452982 RepID=UPI0006937429|nr:EAL domain-containing protein [Roseomonas aerilata]